jgi:hypothetical protein
VTRRKQRPNPITNRVVEDGGKRYRVCYHYSHVMLVGLKCPAGGERILKHGTRRFRQIVAKVPK